MLILWTLTWRWSKILVCRDALQSDGITLHGIHYQPLRGSSLPSTWPCLYRLRAFKSPIAVLSDELCSPNLRPKLLERMSSYLKAKSQDMLVAASAVWTWCLCFFMIFRRYVKRSIKTTSVVSTSIKYELVRPRRQKKKNTTEESPEWWAIKKFLSLFDI